MGTNFSIQTDQADAHRCLNRALNLVGNLTAGDLLGANTRAHIIRPMTEPETAKTLFGLRQSSTHRLWRALVKRCADSPRALGFLRVDGGLRGFGEELGCNHTTLSRNLKTWETRHPPLVVTGYQQRSRAPESLALIQIPLLTEWLLWTAEVWARCFSQQPDNLSNTNIVDIQRILVPRGMPPSSDITRQDAVKLLDSANSPDQSHKEVLVGVDLVNRQRLEERIQQLREKRHAKFRKIRRTGYEQREARRHATAAA